MRLKVIVHETNTSGLWAEIPSLPGCISRGNNYQELINNLYSTVERKLAIDKSDLNLATNSKLMEVIL